MDFGVQPDSGSRYNLGMLRRDESIPTRKSAMPVATSLPLPPPPSILRAGGLAAVTLAAERSESLPRLSTWRQTLRGTRFHDEGRRVQAAVLVLRACERLRLPQSEPAAAVPQGNCRTVVCRVVPFRKHHAPAPRANPPRPWRRAERRPTSSTSAMPFWGRTLQERSRCSRYGPIRLASPPPASARPHVLAPCAFWFPDKVS